MPHFWKHKHNHCNPFKHSDLQFRPIQFKPPHHDQAEHTEKHIYSINGIQCDKNNCADLIRKLAHNGGNVKIKKQIMIKDNQDSATFSLNFSLKGFVINKVLSSGMSNYQRLIELVLSALDSGVNAERDFGNNFNQFEKDLTECYTFLFSFEIVDNSPLFSELQQLYTEYTRLIFTNLVFALSTGMSKEGESYLERYGDACFPPIAFPNSSGEKQEMIDVESAKIFIDTILNNVSSVEKSLKETDTYIPAARDFALSTLKDIEDMAKKYSAIFDETLRASLCLQ